MASILVVCTGNICRSPMGEAFLRRDLASLGSAISVSSAGIIDLGGSESPAHAQSVMASRGLDISDHRSRLATMPVLLSADLILCMAREHVRAIVGQDVELFQRTFTFGELLRRGGALDDSSELDFSAWVVLAHGRRAPQDLRGEFTAEDVVDPFGKSKRRYRHTAETLDSMSRELTEILPG